MLDLVSSTFSGCDAGFEEADGVKHRMVADEGRWGLQAKANAIGGGPHVCGGVEHRKFDKIRAVRWQVSVRRVSRGHGLRRRPTESQDDAGFDLRPDHRDVRRDIQFHLLRESNMRAGSKRFEMVSF